MAWIIPVLLSVFTLASGSPDSGGWGGATAMAIEKGSHEGIRARLRERNTGNPLEVDFARAVAAWKASGSTRDVRGVLERNFMGPLADAFAENSPETYAALLGDKSVPDPAKEILLQALIEKTRYGETVRTQRIPSALERIAADSSLPVPLRTRALRGLAVGKDPRNGDSVYVPFLKGTDPDLKAAAYWSLGMRIRSNTRHGRQAENIRIFHLLKGLAEADSGLHPIRALAQLGLDSARDYLAVKCAGNPRQILIVLRHDPDPRHPGILSEALKVGTGSQMGLDIRAEILARVRRPEGLVTGLLGGTNVQIETGLKLLGTLPALVSRYETAILGFKSSPDTAIRTAALALSPSNAVPNPAAP